MENNYEWIMKYLVGKLVMKSDLTEFFTIQNDGFAPKFTQPDENHFRYQLLDIVYEIEVEKTEKFANQYLIKDVNLLIDLA